MFARINEGNIEMTKIHELAKLMIAEGFTGQGMRNKKAADYICMAADNPDVENDLPQTGFSFWRFAEFYFRLWKARKKFGDTIKDDPTQTELDEITEFLDLEVARPIKRLFLIHREIREIMNMMEQMGGSDLLSNALNRIAYEGACS
jgi:hypothetical protein